MNPTITIPTVENIQSWRRDLHDGVLAMLEAFTAAYPDYVRCSHHALPLGRLGEGPYVYIADIRESIEHTEGLRITTFAGAFGYVDTLVDPEETDDRVNLWADYMRDVCTANVRMLPPGVFAQTGLHEEELPEGSLAPQTNVVIEWRFTVQEGRA